MSAPTADDTTTGPAPGGQFGITGNRQLLAVQTIDIARLTTFPVPIVPGTFIAVSGEGPKGDSNGSGKTSFLAAFSLLHGEAQWRLESDGGRYATEMLFDPEAAGVAETTNYRPMDRGYVIGVFADPVPPHLDPDAARALLADTAISVWLRLSATPQYIRVRWTRGLYVPEGETEAERADVVDEMWKALPHTREHPEIGPKSMAVDLFGEAPRCMAYLDTTLRPSAPSLLSQQMTEMSPERIGESLIALTGREHLLESEQEQRRVLAAQQLLLTEREMADREARLTEATELDGVEGRQAARDLLREGEHLWRLHYARGYLDVLTVHAAAEEAVRAKQTERDAVAADLATAEDVLEQVSTESGLEDEEAAAAAKHARAATAYQEAATSAGVKTAEIQTLTRQRNELRRIAAAWSRTPIGVLEDREQTARGEREHAAADRLSAARHVAAAQAAVAAAHAGGGGPAGETRAALRDVVPTAILLDEITLDPDARAAWEPRLFPHRHAVVIAPGDETAALPALATRPGASLVHADGPLDTPPAPGTLPTGVHTTLPLAGFLTALADRVHPAADPDRGIDGALGETTLGGFPTEIAGRAARIAAAEAELATAQAELETAQGAETQARLALEALVDDLAAARASEQAALLDETEKRLVGELAALEGKVATTKQTAEELQAAYLDVAARRQAHDKTIELARTRRDNLAKEVTRLTGEVGKLVEERGKVPVTHWKTGWGDTTEAAEAVLDDMPEEWRTLRTQSSFRGRASDALKDALDAYRRGVHDLPEDLAEVVQRRSQLTAGEGGVSGASVDFTTIAQPLRDLLDSVEERDQVVADRIHREQAERELELSATRAEVDLLVTDLRSVQEMVAASLTLALDRISAELDRLDRSRGGFGAELVIVHEPPTDPAMSWKWSITPRWRRSPTGKMTSYRRVANGAQIKVFAIQLVLAALLAGEGASGRVLVLDELGNSLGDANRRDVLTALRDVAADMNLTILGTCQDSVLKDAADACGEILWFSHASHTDVYNQPTRAWGYDPNGDRVRLTAPWLRQGRGLI